MIKYIYKNFYIQLILKQRQKHFETRVDFLINPSL